MSDRVHDELLSAIRDMRLKPGAVLSETDLAEQLGVSRTPLRAAISKLVDQELVIVVPQVGTSVALIDVTAVEEACFIRASLESAAFELACAVPNRNVSTLRRILARQEEAISAEDGDQFFSSDESLHEEIFRIGGHAPTWNVVRRSKLHLDRLRRLILPAALSTRDLVDEHSRIVDLLEAGDAVAGKALIEVHAGHVLRQLPAVRAEYPHFFSA
jgi:DNA-binding GntR family transcriptional regulator